jgi:hypothetical protein
MTANRIIGFKSRFGLRPQRLAAQRRTYATSWDINRKVTTVWRVGRSRPFRIGDLPLRLKPASRPPTANELRDWGLDPLPFSRAVNCWSKSRPLKHECPDPESRS